MVRRRHLWLLALPLAGCAPAGATLTGSIPVERPDGGGLDGAFGRSGIVTTDLRDGDDLDRAQAIALFADGGIVVAGSSRGDAGRDVALVRYDAAGRLDAGFGEHGRLLVDLGGDEDALAVAVDGGDVIAGGATSAGKAFVTRIRADGSRDPAFGIGGFAGVERLASVVALAVDAEGRIVVAGPAPAGDRTDFGIARLEAGGSPDETFAMHGVAVMDVLGDADEPAAIALAADGSLVVAGTSLKPDGRNGIGVVRLTADGALDTAWGAGGRASVAADDGESALVGHALAIDAAGRVLVAGTLLDPDGDDFAVARFDAAGHADATFGASGLVRVAGSGDDDAWGVGLDGDRIVVSGQTGEGGGAFAVARLRDDGIADTTFGRGGREVTDFGAGWDAAWAQAIQPDGRILVAGHQEAGGEEDFALVRYLP